MSDASVLNEPAGTRGARSGADHVQTSHAAVALISKIVFAPGRRCLAALVISLALWQKVSGMQEQLARQAPTHSPNPSRPARWHGKRMSRARHGGAAGPCRDARARWLCNAPNSKSHAEPSRSRDENLVVDIDAAVRLALQQAQVTGNVSPCWRRSRRGTCEFRAPHSRVSRRCSAQCSTMPTGFWQRERRNGEAPRARRTDPAWTTCPCSMLWACGRRGNALQVNPAGRCAGGSAPSMVRNEEHARCESDVSNAPRRCDARPDLLPAREPQAQAAQRLSALSASRRPAATSTVSASINRYVRPRVASSRRDVGAAAQRR
jgi:hypothetical protein